MGGISTKRSYLCGAVCALLVLFGAAAPALAAEYAAPQLDTAKTAYVQQLASTQGKDYAAQYKARLLEYQAPQERADVVFLGDSLTCQGDWTTFSDQLSVANRGINGDALPGLEIRLDQVKALKPRAVFLLIGINDFAVRMRPVVYRDYAAFLDHLAAALSDTDIYVESILPVREDMRVIMSNDTIIMINKKLSTIAQEHGMTFNDAHAALYDAKERALRKTCQVDGLHLNAAGYKAWKAVLAPYIEPYLPIP